MNGQQEIDVAIVGGGAAGLNAALVLGRSRRRVVVYDEGKPRNTGVPHAYGFLGHDGISGAELLRRGRAEIAAYGVDVVEARVDDIVPEGEGFSVVTAHGGRRARIVVLATGLRDHLPAIPGLREIWGIDAAECPYCHGWEVRDRAIGVVGTTDKLPRVAALLTQWSRDVMVISADAAGFDAAARARLDAVGVQIVPQAVERFALTDAGRLRGVVTDDGREIPREAIFVAMPTRSASDLAARLCDVDAGGFALVDPEGRTSRPGVWAVGNATDRIAKLVHSAAAGSRAAASINVTLFEQDMATRLGSRA